MGSLQNGVERLILNGREEDKEEEKEEEPILKEQNERFCMFPIRYKQLWEMYKKAEASFWTGTFTFFLNRLVFLCIFSEILIISFSSATVRNWVSVFFFLFEFLVVIYGVGHLYLLFEMLVVSVAPSYSDGATFPSFGGSAKVP